MDKEELTITYFQDCSECGSTNLKRYENGRTICLECGFVITSNALKLHKLKSQQVMQKTRYNRSSNEGIHREIRESFFEKSSLNRDELIDRWWRSACVSDQTEKNLVIACSEIIQIGFALSLPKEVLDKASRIYRTIIEKHNIGGKNIQALAACAIYIACRQNKQDCNLKEIARISNIKEKKLGRYYRYLVKELNCSIPVLQMNHFLSKFSNKLALESDVEEIAMKILTAVTESKLALGKDPIGTISAVIYIASLLAGKNKTQREIAETARVTEATIRNRCKEFREKLLYKMPV